MVLTRRLALTLALNALAFGCVPVHTARLSADEPVHSRERAARERIDSASCSARWSLLVPGIGQMCRGKTVEGTVLTSLATIEVGAAIAAATSDAENKDLVITASLGAVQNVWLYAGVDPVIEASLADRDPYTPQDTLGELAYAPFNPEVIGNPWVFGGIIGAFGAALGFTFLRDPDFRLGRPNPAPRIFGVDDPVVGYGAVGVGAAGLFEHVAIGEEIVFRGLLQSSLVRKGSEWKAWGWGSVIFGAAHIPNALVVEDDPESYIKYDVPFITLVGSYLGLAYMQTDYTLTTPVAVHFWYDFLLAVTLITWSPDSPLMVRYGSAF